MKALKVLVLLVSIAGGSLVVWNATRDKGEEKGNEIGPHEMIGSSKSKVTGLDLLDFDTDDMQVSPKSGPIMLPEDVAEIVEHESSEIIITAEEVERTRKAMLSTSKSGRIMNDDQIREMLEERKKEELKHKKARKLMPSSKSIDAILKPKDVKEIIEGDEPENLPELNLIPSSKNPNRILKREDIEQIIEGRKSDFEKPLEPKLPPLEK